MAFGKDKAYLKQANFQQQARRSMNKPKSGRGYAPHFVNSYKPPTHGTDIIRLIPGKYEVPIVDHDEKDYLRDANGEILKENLAYWQYIEHFHGGKKKSSVCSCGPLGAFKDKGEPCIGCQWFWYEYNKRKATGEDRPRSMSRRDMWAFTVLVMGTFHKIDDTNEDGQPRVNEKTGKPYFHWERCDGRGCKMCAAGKETKKGHLQHWPIGRSHFNALIDYSQQLSKHCRICGGRDTIEDQAWVCQNEECGEAIIDMSSTSLTDEQIDQMTSDMVTCTHCKQRTYLKCIYTCRECFSKGMEGERATLFDFNLKVKRVEDPNGESNQTSLQIVEAIGPVPIDLIYGEDMRKPMDLPRVYTPTPLERQKALFDEPPVEDRPERTPVYNQYR